MKPGWASAGWQRMRRSLRLRLLASLLMLLLFGATILALAAYRRTLDDADALLDGQMRLLARAIATGLPLDTDPLAPSSIADLQGTDYVVQVWSRDGRRVFSSQPRVLMPDRAVFGFSDWSSVNETWRMYAVQAGERVIQVAQNLNERSRIATALAWRTVLPILLWIPVLLVGSSLVVTRSLRPLALVRAQLAQRKVDDLDPVRADDVPDEVRPLVEELNQLLTRLRASFDAQRAFVADAAHELRTPLAALTLQLQHLARIGQSAEPSPTRQVAIERLGAGIDRASRLVEQLLALAREDGAAAQHSMSPERDPVDLALVELGSVAASIVIELEPLAEARGLDLGIATSEACLQPADRDAIATLLRNLVDNAIKHTPAGGTIDLSVQIEGGRAVLRVEDSGPGIAEADRARAFDRFTRIDVAAAGLPAAQLREAGSRIDASPVPTTRPIGSGLGLAIVKAIADRHHASVSLGPSKRLGGLQVEVRFNRAAPDHADRPVPASAPSERFPSD